MAGILGTVTIGQSPRNDLIPEMLEVMGMGRRMVAGTGEGVRILEAGALDGLTLEDVQRLAPESGDYVLVTRMADGTAVKIAEKHIIPRMQDRIDYLLQRGADAVALVCTGEFPQFTCSRMLVVPQKVLFHTVAGVLGGAGGGSAASGSGLCASKLGVFLPDADQVEHGLHRWGEVTPAVRIVAASPYGSPEAIEIAARQLKEYGAELVVMDCIGYTLAMKETVRRVTGVPVILARSILARVLAELG